ncbi:MAG: molybdopterin-dependent oxidoreductase [Isosphaeraceae bacterium]|nr:molybdopterin-dependent oxidoreductase [Isosphaeraceae bacterium]
MHESQTISSRHDGKSLIAARANGELTRSRSVCHLCHGGCGMVMEVANGRLASVRPDPESPFSLGYACAKGLATPELMYHPSRLLAPLKRVGERGAGSWKVVGWDEALGEIAAALRAIKDQHGAREIALGQGTARHHYCHVRRFANQLGTPNWYEPGLANCFLPRVTASYFTYGGLLVGDFYGATPPRTVVIWGCNPVVSNPDGKLGFRVRDALRGGAFGIAVDPRRSETARLCDLWLPVRPGTDAALALAMCHVIIAERLYDEAFVQKWTVGFDELARHLAAFSPAWASKVTGIPAEDIDRAARRYATAGPAAIEWGVAIDQNVNSFQTARALCILRALTGNIDNPGGEIFGESRLRSYPLQRTGLNKAAVKGRLGANDFKLLGGPAAIVPSAHIPALFRAMRTGEPHPIRALLTFGNNPLLTVANASDVREALARLELFVAVDMFLTPSAALADYVLPAAFWPELDQVSELPAFAPLAVVAQHRVVRTGQCRSDEEIIDELARRMGLPGSDKAVGEILNHRLEPLNVTFEDMKETPTRFYPPRYSRYREQGFATPSGKVELLSQSLARLGYDSLPTYREPPESPVSSPAATRTFPYVLTTGMRRAEYFHSEQRQSARMRKRRPEPVAELHPETAAANTVRNRDWVVIRSPRGAIKMRAHVSTNIVPGVVAVEHGWWFPEQGPGGDAFASNANVLTADGPPYDPAMGSYQLRGLLCSVERLREDDPLNGRD